MNLYSVILKTCKTSQISLRDTFVFLKLVFMLLKYMLYLS